MNKKLQTKDFSQKIARYLVDNEKIGGSFVFCTASLSRIFECLLQIDFVLSERKQDQYKFYVPESLK